MTAYEFYNERLGIQQEELLNELACVTTRRTVPKGGFLIRVGQPYNNLYLLESGLVRSFFVDKQGQEHTVCIIRPEKEIIAVSVAEVEQRGASPTNMQALTDVSAFSLPVTAMMELRNRYPEVDTAYMRLLKISLDTHLEHQRIWYQCTAAERYQWFQDYYPGVEAKMLKKDIASFLDVSPQTLSRVIAGEEHDDNR